MRLRRLSAALALSLLIGLASAGAPAAEARTSCKAGATRYAAQGVRIFEITKRDENDVDYQLLLACRPGSKRPTVLYVGSHGGVTTEWQGAEREGNRVIWQYEEFADGGGAVTVGWFGARDGAHRSAPVEWKFGRPRATALAPGGGIVVVTFGAEFNSLGESVEYLAPGRHSLHSPRVLVPSVVGTIVPDSLKAAGGVVTWTTQEGAVGSVPLGP